MTRDHEPEAKKDSQVDVVVEYDDHLDDSAPDNSHVPSPKDDDFENLEDN